MASVTKVAAGLIIFRRLNSEVQYLLLQASYGNFHWSPPKGHLDPGETEIQAAMRETEEEAGYNPQQLTIMDTFQSVLNYKVRGKPKRVVYWLSELKDPSLPVVLSDEHKDYKWLGIKEAIKIAKYQDMQSALKEADEFISNL